MPEFTIGNVKVGTGHKVFFIADISANHDGSLEKAKLLCELAWESGANCAKFQHFRADHIVSKRGFESMEKLAHQAGWKENVYEAFKRLSLPWEWTHALASHCHDIGIEFMSTPYDHGCVDHLDPYVNAFKIGSGDITYIDLVKHIASKGKPVLLSSGASSFADVIRAMHTLRNVPTCLMQCNTNYTGDDNNNLEHINLNVLSGYARAFPQAVIGLSDHTVGHTTVMGAVALGAKVIEKHFTDNYTLVGPDHGFSIAPGGWKQMVSMVRELEGALGNGMKRIETNEFQTVVLQRRCLRAARSLPAGHCIEADDIVALRPAPAGTMAPFEARTLIGRVTTEVMEKGDPFYV